MVRASSILLFLLSIISSSLLAHDYTVGSINIDHPWSPQAPPNSQTLAVYFQIKNSANKADVLLSASSPIAKKVEIHTHEMVGDVMKMSQLGDVNIRGKRLTIFRQGGLHLMLFEPTKIPSQGDKFELTLFFKEAKEVTVEVAVEGKGHKHEH